MIHSLSPDFPAAFEKVDHFLLLETFFRGFQRWCPCRTFPGVLGGASSELLGLSPEPQTPGSNCLLNIYLHLELNVSEVKSPPNPPQTSSPSPDAIFQRTAPPSSNSQEQDGKTMLERAIIDLDDIAKRALSLSMATFSHTYELCCVPHVVIQDALGVPGLSAEPRTTTGGQ
ncbi:uncharacterized protein [Callorhinus ursinus]|uniref:Uncharacterized protein LOC112832807 isoform X3 n=1 Tax=Callorhinus ursinus TaxID=34884 RepID=A0A3Q7Q0K5_CALUR|nr:uncharacterized protein LOC112832807 isoform X3 [Callorhinus ursinus]